MGWLGGFNRQSRRFSVAALKPPAASRRIISRALAGALVASVGLGVCAWAVEAAITAMRAHVVVLPARVRFVIVRIAVSSLHRLRRKAPPPRLSWRGSPRGSPGNFGIMRRSGRESA
jgi:hypothetical protein